MPTAHNRTLHLYETRIVYWWYNNALPTARYIDTSSDAHPAPLQLHLMALQSHAAKVLPAVVQRGLRPRHLLLQHGELVCPRGAARR